MLPRRLAVKAAAASRVATLPCLPWLLQAVAGARGAVQDWIVGYWKETPPYAAILRSLEAFGFGGAHPTNLPAVALAPSLRIPSLIVTLGLLAVAIAPWGDRRPAETGRSTTLTLLAFLFVPLLGQWVCSI